MSKQPIGIFDSGIGGLTVLKAIRKLLPHENIVYYADTLNIPYGNKSPQQIIQYSNHIINWLQTHANVKCVIAACHTSSANALELIESKFSIPIIGTIKPSLTTILTNPAYSRIGILATPTSIKSQTHKHSLRNSGFTGKILNISCPEYVENIEKGNFFSANLKALTQTYLQSFNENNLNTLLYACTHYPLINEIIKAELPTNTQTIDPAYPIAIQLKKHLEQMNMYNKNEQLGTVTSFCSGATPHQFYPLLNTILATEKESTFCLP